TSACGGSASTARRGCSTAEQLFAMGGWCKYEDYLDTAECFDLERKFWAPIKRMPFALSHFASAVLRNKLYLVGGVTDTAAHGTVPGTTSATGLALVAMNNGIYVIGGYFRSRTRHNERWSETGNLAAHGFLFHNQKLYAMGGWCQFQSFLNLAEAFDLATGTWATIAKLPFALSHPASSVFQNKLYLLGGATGVSGQWLFHKGFLIYETSSNTWTQVPLSTGFFAAGAVAGDRGIYVIGGYIEKKIRGWVEGLLIPENRVVSCGKRIYVLGGEDLAHSPCPEEALCGYPRSQNSKRDRCAACIRSIRHTHISPYFFSLTF
uniref:Uncharacterized protein n=1 Tax=Podarcis muralis TaxID=64176 RepID=A0A670INI3_PODMU